MERNIILHNWIFLGSRPLIPPPLVHCFAIFFTTQSIFLSDSLKIVFPIFASTLSILLCQFDVVPLGISRHLQNCLAVFPIIFRRSLTGCFLFRRIFSICNPSFRLARFILFLRHVCFSLLFTPLLHFTFGSLPLFFGGIPFRGLCSSSPTPLLTLRQNDLPVFFVVFPLLLQKLLLVLLVVTFEVRLHLISMRISVHLVLG